jgi:hypothetical protein
MMIKIKDSFSTNKTIDWLGIYVSAVTWDCNVCQKASVQCNTRW